MSSLSRYMENTRIFPLRVLIWVLSSNTRLVFRGCYDADILLLEPIVFVCFVSFESMLVLRILISCSVTTSGDFSVNSYFIFNFLYLMRFMFQVPDYYVEGRFP